MGSVSEATRVRRSVMFVPGIDPRKIDRARESSADTVVLDLEDAVAPEKKGEARTCTTEALRTGSFGESETAVRINPPGTPFFEDDLAAVVAAGVPTIMLPKAERPDVVAAIAARLASGTALLLLVESPLGVSNVLALADAAAGTEAICFGHADFALQMGLSDAESTNPVVHHARCSVSVAAKAHGLTPIDCVHVAVKDDATFAADTALGLSLGYEGKLCIHPRQAERVNEIYTPSADQVGYAERVVAGWNEALREGHGVLTIDGKMVDAPLVAQQERVLARARR